MRSRTQLSEMHQNRVDYDIPRNRERRSAEYGSLAEASPESFDADRLDLRVVLGILRRRKWTIISTFVFGIVMALLAISQLSQQYTAQALVVVDRRDSQLVGFEGGFDQGFSSNMIVDTEVEIAKSARVLQRVAISLNLVSSPDLREGNSWLDVLGFGGEQETGDDVRTDFAELPQVERVAIVERLSRRLDVRRRGLTNIISIEARASSAEQASTLANAVADSYLAEQIASRLDSTENAVAFLRSRVENLARSISNAETSIDVFVTEKLQEIGSPVARELLEELANETRSRETDAKLLSDLQGALSRQDAARLAQLAESQQVELVARREALAQILQGSSEIAEQEIARRRLEALDQEIREASQERAASLRIDIALSESRSSNFRRQLEASLADMQLPNDVAIDLVRLQRDVETQRVLYDNFLGKLRQIEQQADFDLPDSRVIAEAAPPTNPSFPPRRLILIGAALFSLSAGIGLALLRETYLGGITSIEQFENLTAVPVVAAIPKLTGSQSRPDIAIVEEPLSAFSEAIRRARMGLDSLRTDSNNCLFITSNLPGDGKTTIALAMARHFALTNSSTLLIDADLRNPSVHRLIDCEAGEGLVGFLSKGEGEVTEQLTITKEASSNAHFVLGAPESMQATDALLMSRRFGDLLAYARETYDVVIVDTPPIGLFVDAAIVAGHCDIGVYVARYASTAPQQVRSNLRDLMRTSDVTMCGVINMVAKSDLGAYGYGGDYYKQYGYGNS